jgi:hypothetical protein
MKKSLLIGLMFFSAVYVQSQNKIESSLEESYNNGVWELSSGTNYQYDTNDNLLSETRYYYDGSGWSPFYKTIYTYNANNKAATRIEQFANSLTSVFEDNYKTIYTYNGSGKLITNINQMWNGSSWVNEYKADITYNGNLFLTVTNTTWDGAQWVLDSRNTPTYTGTNLTQFLDEIWDGMQWNNDFRNNMTYNATNKITNLQSEFWTGTAWEEDETTTYTFATNGNRTSSIYTYEGQIQSKNEYNYDTASQMSNFGHPFKDKTGVDYVFESFPYINKILSSMYYDYDSDTSTYELSYRTTYNYQNQLPLDKQKFEISKIKLYPNPSNSILNIQMEQHIDALSIVDISGRSTAIKALSNKSFDVSTLANGVYFIEIATAQGVFKEKFIKN